MLDCYPIINYQEMTIEGISKKGYFISTPGKSGFVYAKYDNKSVKIILNYHESESVLESQPCHDPEFAHRLLELNIFREAEYALQLMYDNELLPSTIEWKTEV